MADVLNIVATVASVIGAGGLGAGVMKWSLDRRENQRVWHRDKVTERYTAATSALLALTRVFAETVEPLMQHSPMSDLDEGFVALNEAYGDLVGKVSDALVVARPRAWHVLLQCIRIDCSVLTPITRPAGFPPIAGARLNLEQEFIADVSAMLLLTMRADLELWDKKQLAYVDRKLASFLTRAAAPRSLFATVSPEFVLPNLGHYGVHPIMMSYSGYLMRSVYLDQLCEEWLPNVAAESIEAVFIREGDNELFACVRIELPPEHQLIRLRQIGMTVESATHHSPGVDGWRDLPSGGKIWIWRTSSRFML